MKQNKPLVSVIVTTKNEEHCLGDCLKSIRDQTYPGESREIIVVDNDSSDATKDIAREFADKVLNQGPERSAQRNLGILKAQGEYVLYLDADMILSKDVIKQCVDKCQLDDCIALYIPEVIVGKGFWIKVRNFERSFYNATCIDAVRFVERDKALAIGGFDENLTGPEDWDFDRRIKAKGEVGLISSCLYHDEGDFDFGKYLKKKVYYSKTFQQYIDKWGGSDRIVKKQLGFSYRFFKVFTEAGKWRKLIRHPFLALGMYVLRLSLGLKFLICKNQH